MSSFLPALLEQKLLLRQGNLIIFSAHFLFITAITLPFDIRDCRADRASDLIAFPHLIGIRKTKVLAQF